MKTTMRTLMIAAFSMAVPALAAAAYPSRPITEVVPYPAGGGTDLAGRAMANAMHDVLGVNVVVDNRAGGGGSVGNASVARARPDGYTIGVAPLGSIVNQPHMHRVPYGVDSFDYLCRFYSVPELLVVKPGSPFHDLKSLVAYARKHPGELTFGSPGPGTLPHVDMERFLQQVGIKMTHVPFKGDAPAMTALMGGHIDVYITSPNTVHDQNLKPVALFSKNDMSDFPNSKTAIEQGFDFVSEISGGLIAPKGLPAAVKSKLVDACKAASHSEDLKKVLNRVGFQPRFLAPDDYRAAVQKAYRINGALIDKVIKHKGGE